MNVYMHENAKKDYLCGVINVEVNFGENMHD